MGETGVREIDLDVDDGVRCGVDRFILVYYYERTYNGYFFILLCLVTFDRISKFIYETIEVHVAKNKTCMFRCNDNIKVTPDY